MNTLVHTSSRTADNALRVARVAAAGRIQAAREAAEAREAAGLARNLAMATEVVEDWRALGAVEVGTKISFRYGGKWRPVLTLDSAAESLARWIADGDDVEAWGVNAAGEVVGEGLGVW